MSEVVEELGACMTEPSFSVALERHDQLFQKYLARRAAGEQEVEIALVTGKDVRGFVTALDDGWVQICPSSGILTPTLVSRAAIADIRATGRVIDSVANPDDIKKFTQLFRKVSQKELDKTE